VVCESFLNVQTSKQRGKNWQLVGGLAGTGALIVQPARWLICHWAKVLLSCLSKIGNANFVASLEWTQQRRQQWLLRLILSIFRQRVRFASTRWIKDRCNGSREAIAKVPVYTMSTLWSSRCTNNAPPSPLPNNASPPPHRNRRGNTSSSFPVSSLSSRVKSRETSTASTELPVLDHYLELRGSQIRSVRT